MKRIGGLFFALTLFALSSGVSFADTPPYTHYPATPVTAGTSAQIGTSSVVLTSLMVDWATPSTTTNCYLTLYNSASPVVGTGFVAIYSLNTSAPGELAIPVPPTAGGTYSPALTYAITTLPGGSVACNTLASQMWVEAWYR